MKRLRRLALNLLLTGFLLLFIANAAWWVRSYFIADVIMRLSTDRSSSASTTRPATPYSRRQILAFAPMCGRYQIGYTSESQARFTLLPDGWMRESVPTRLMMTSRGRWTTLGFGYYHNVLPTGVVVTVNGSPIQDPATAAPLAESWNLWVPCWFVSLLTGIIPAIWLWSLSGSLKDNALANAKTKQRATNRSSARLGRRG